MMFRKDILGYAKCSACITITTMMMSLSKFEYVVLVENVLSFKFSSCLIFASYFKLRSINNLEH